MDQIIEMEKIKEEVEEINRHSVMKFLFQNKESKHDTSVKPSDSVFPASSLKPIIKIRYYVKY